MQTPKSYTRRGFFHLAGAAGTGAAIGEAVGAVPTPAAAQAAPPRRATVFSVTDFGATGDGHTIDTPAINKAIDAAATSGGGTVLFPAGTYASFSIHLRSNVELRFERGATLLARRGRALRRRRTDHFLGPLPGLRP